MREAHWVDGTPGGTNKANYGISHANHVDRMSSSHAPMALPLY